MRMAKDLAKELLAYLDRESIPSAAVSPSSERMPARAWIAAHPAVVEKRGSPKPCPFFSDLGCRQAGWLRSHCWRSCRLASIRPGARRQRKSLRLHDIPGLDREQYGVHYAENTGRACAGNCDIRRCCRLVSRAQPGFNAGLPSNHPKNHYAIHACVLEKIKQLVENLANYRAKKNPCQITLQTGHALSGVPFIFQKGETQ